MRATKNDSPKNSTSPLKEPVYVDEVYPEEPLHDEPWARKDAPQQAPPPAALPLEFADEDESEAELEEEKVETPELPRPVRREPGTVPPKPTRERTGTWPVSNASHPEPKRNAQPKNGLPPRGCAPSKEHPPASVSKVQPGTPQRPSSPNAWQEPYKPPAPPDSFFPPIPEPEPFTQVKSLTPPARAQEALPPPPRMSPSHPLPAAKVFPAEESPPPEKTSFRPLVDETVKPVVEESLEELTEEIETSWELEPNRPPTVHDLIERLALPKNSLILGVCDDGLPLVLELSDPSPGALLFLGDEVEGMQKHLQAVLASICLMSDPKQVQVDIITPARKAFVGQKMYPHVQKVHLPNQDEMFDLLGSLFELIEQRQRKDNSLAGRFFKEFLPPNKGPVRILLIDQVDVLVEQLAPESLAYLRWLLRRGPAVNVWVLASLNTRNAQAIDGKTLKAFGLRISGKMQNALQASRLTDVPVEKLSSLVSGEQACLKLDEEIVEFSILD